MIHPFTWVMLVFAVLHSQPNAHQTLGMLEWRMEKWKMKMDLKSYCFYLSMGLGFIIGFWTFCGALKIKNSWRNALF